MTSNDHNKVFAMGKCDQLSKYQAKKSQCQGKVLFSQERVWIAGRPQIVFTHEHGGIIQKEITPFCD